MHAYYVPGTGVSVNEHKFRDRSKNRNQPTTQAWRPEEHRKTQKALEQFLADPGISSCPCPPILVLPRQTDVKKAEGREVL